MLPLTSTVGVVFPIAIGDEVLLELAVAFFAFSTRYTNNLSIWSYLVRLISSIAWYALVPPLVLVDCNTVWKDASPTISLWYVESS